MTLKNKVAFITGAGRGIGRAIAMAFAREGASVVLASRTVLELDETVHSITGIGGNATGIPTDVSKFADVKRAVDACLHKYGSVNILVNCAAVQSPIGAFIETDVDEWFHAIEINLMGTAHAMRCALPTMTTLGSGKIINFSGGGATAPRQQFSAYAVSKTAICRLTETVADEVKEYDIDVNAIAPGAVNTRMLHEILQEKDRAGAKEVREADKRMREGGTPMEKPVGLALFLASSASDGITGKLISAVWDPWENKEFQAKLRTDRNLATLRRIDSKYFSEMA